MVNPLCPLCSKAIFVLICLLVTSFSCSLATFELAFRVKKENIASSNSQYETRKHYILFGLSMIVELFFLIRFIGNFSLGYFDDEGLLVTKKSAIIRRLASNFEFQPASVFVLQLTLKKFVLDTLLDSTG